MSEEGSCAVAPPKVATKPRPASKPEVQRPIQWNVVLLDDEDHSYEYVMRMMKELFSHPLEKGFKIAERVDTSGRAVCLTTHKEHAELKRDQIHAYGRDVLIARCQGSMTAIIEPAESDGEDDDSTGGSGSDA